MIDSGDSSRRLKLAIARSQLGTSLELFIRDRDPLSVHALACGGCEIIEGVAQTSGAATVSSHVLQTHPEIDFKKLKRLRNQHWNAIKHFYESDNKSVRDDVELMSEFGDRQNDAPLFMGWFDYAHVVGKLPVEVQVFQVWWYALNEDKLVSEAPFSSIRSLFPGIGEVSRSEQKRRLRRAIEKYRTRKEILSDPRTEEGPLSRAAFEF